MSTCVATMGAAVIAPIGVLSIAPPEIVRSFATFPAAIAVPLHVPVVIVPTVAILDPPA